MNFDVGFYIMLKIWMLRFSIVEENFNLGFPVPKIINESGRNDWLPKKVLIIKLHYKKINFSQIYSNRCWILIVLPFKYLNIVINKALFHGVIWAKQKQARGKNTVITLDGQKRSSSEKIKVEYIFVGWSHKLQIIYTNMRL